MCIYVYWVTRGTSFIKLIMTTNFQTGLGDNGGLCTQFACLQSPSKVINYSQYLSVVS